ncbi:MAG: carboxypeptidase M32 [Clostridia bacterium]|nr:carboxypeptidase M32 [Clostridia bacterium]MBR3129228.1 carboxypeptidase M32 [Clostridia bacterium]
MIQETVARYRAYLEKLRAYHHAMGLMSYDMNTIMPKGAGAIVGDTLGVLSEVDYEMETSPEVEAMQKEILAHRDEVDPVIVRTAELAMEERERIACIPKEEYVQFTIDQTIADQVWHEAKLKSDFRMFLPHLEKLIESVKRFARYYRPDAPVYDTLLDTYEKGLNTATLDRFFATVRERLVPVIAKIKEQPDVSFLHTHYPIADQRIFSDYLMDVLGLDRNHCIIGETEHPFTTEFTKYDVRITTHYHEDMVEASMYSVIHEGGHATYERNVADEIARLPIGCGVSMSVHECQSRFFENIIGRSEPFCEAIFPKMQEIFPEQLKGVTAHQFYVAVNKAEPSLVRTEADELTYALHVMVRYELEKRLFDGDLKAKDLPAEWNRMYKEYLGIDVPDDRRGVLQDSHWASALFGYFPSYALGSAYGAQLIKRMEREIDVWNNVRAGNLKPIVEWLTEHIYRFGCMKEPTALMEEAFGAPFDPTYYTDYLTEKFTALYNLK